MVHSFVKETLNILAPTLSLRNTIIIVENVYSKGCLPKECYTIYFPEMYCSSSLHIAKSDATLYTSLSIPEYCIHSGSFLNIFFQVPLHPLRHSMPKQCCSFLRNAPPIPAMFKECIILSMDHCKKVMLHYNSFHHVSLFSMNTA